MGIIHLLRLFFSRVKWPERNEGNKGKYFPRFNFQKTEGVFMLKKEKRTKLKIN